MKIKNITLFCFVFCTWNLFALKIHQKSDFTGNIITNISCASAITGLFIYVPEADSHQPIPYWQMTNYVANLGAKTTNEVVNSDFGDGSDGNIIISAADTVVNNYSYLTGDETSSDATITLNSASSFSDGDEILIIQSQDSANGNQGVFEFAKVLSKAGNILTLTANLSNDYFSGTFDTQNAKVAQVVRVPNYADVTINSGASIIADDWLGYSGGIVVFKATGTVNFVSGGKINVSLQGFRGGHCNGGGDNSWGQQGEGFPGLGTNSLANNGNGGGGGYGPSGFAGEPGAGGGHIANGGNGVSTYTSTGGVAVGNVEFSTLFFGGGGGGGGDNDSVTPLPIGGAGGGIAMVFAPVIANPDICSTGNCGIAPGGAGGTSGGGGGGAIWLVANIISNSQLNVSGGAGGVDSDDISGDGAGGRLLLNYDNSEEIFHIYDDGVAIVKKGFFQGYLTTSEDVGGTVEYLKFEAETRKDFEYFEHSNSSNPEEIIIKKAGWYKISYAVSWFQNSGDNNRHCMHVWAENNGSVIIPSSSYCYTRDDNYGQYDSCVATFITEVISENIKIKLGAQRVDGTADPQALADKSWILIEKI